MAHSGRSVVCPQRLRGRRRVGRNSAFVHPMFVRLNLTRCWLLSTFHTIGTPEKRRLKLVSLFNDTRTLCTKRSTRVPRHGPNQHVASRKHILFTLEANLKRILLLVQSQTPFPCSCSENVSTSENPVIKNISYFSCMQVRWFNFLENKHF